MIQEPLASLKGYTGPVNAFVILLVVLVWLYVLFRTAQRTPIKVNDNQKSVADFNELGLYYAGSRNEYTEVKATGGGTRASVEEVQASLLNITPVDKTMVEIGDKIYTAPEILAEKELSNAYEQCLFDKEETEKQLCSLGIQQGSWQKLTDDETYTRRSDSQLKRSVIMECLIKKAREHLEEPNALEKFTRADVWSRIGNAVFGNYPDQMILDGETVVFRSFFCVN